MTQAREAEPRSWFHPAVFIIGQKAGVSGPRKEFVAAYLSTARRRRGVERGVSVTVGRVALTQLLDER
jgi:hypothetical protein